MLSFKDDPTWLMATADVIRTSGKLVVLDRLLNKFHRTGHRVLLFSTMTHLLDLLEVRIHAAWV